jgi:hypothetical protein
MSKLKIETIKVDRRCVIRDPMTLVQFIVNHVPDCVCTDLDIEDTVPEIIDILYDFAVKYENNAEAALAAMTFICGKCTHYPTKDRCELCDAFIQAIISKIDSR